jgi:hypothetical protein
MQLGIGPDHGFTVKTMGGCRLVFGPVPASEFAMLTHGFSKKALMATDIADLIGASFVIGEPADLDDLRKQDLPVSEKRHSDYLAAHAIGLDKVAMWLRKGERGRSSDAMCKRLFGVPASAGTEHPHDPDDLHRCMLFVDAAEAHDQVPLMADVSPAWRKLVATWDQLVQVLREEMKTGTSAPKTYALMKAALGTND